MDKNILIALFDDPNLKFTQLGPGYSELLSPIWQVTTPSGDVILRTSRPNESLNNPFWTGCQMLFGLDPTDPFRFEPMANFINTIGIIPAPRLLKKAVLDGEKYIIVEKLRGSTMESFTDLSSKTMQRFGRFMATIHRSSFNIYGSPFEANLSLTQFHPAIVDTIRYLTERFYSHDLEIVEAAPVICDEILRLPPPHDSSWVMVDLDPTQFLTDGSEITGLVDVEAYTIAPRALDLIALEYVLDEPSASAFKIGYTSVLPLPRLESVRRAYRFLYRLLDIQGLIPLEDWMSHPTYFD